MLRPVQQFVVKSGGRALVNGAQTLPVPSDLRQQPDGVLSCWAIYDDDTAIALGSSPAAAASAAARAALGTP